MRDTVRPYAPPAAVGVALAIALVLLWLSLPGAASAAGVVGNGTAASCTEAALNTALAGGGTVTFDCGPAPATINPLTTKVISAATVLDGGGLVAIRGLKTSNGAGIRLFLVNSGASLELRNITVASGSSPSGAIVRNLGTVTIDNSLVSEALAMGDQGGALYNAGTMTVTNSTLANNVTHAAGGGGAIKNVGTLVVRGSTFVDNYLTDAAGAGIHNQGGTLTVENSTFSRNTVAFGGLRGNSIANSSGGQTTITNSTFHGNTGASALDNLSGTITARNSIVAATIGGYQCFGVTDGGNNIEFTAVAGHGNTCGFSPANGSLPNADPRLGSLASNGGPTQTHALLQGSPAFDAANPAYCPVADQRGAARVGTCDIGSYESQLRQSTATLVETTASPGEGVVSFAATVQAASGGGTPTGAVVFKDGATTLATQSLDGAGVATYTTSALMGGPHTLTAAYSGDAVFRSSTSPPLAVVVTPPAPVVTAPAAQSAVVNVSEGFALGSFGEPGPGFGPWTVVVNWGDGSPNTSFSAPARGSLAARDHTYATHGAKLVTVSVTNAVGIAGSATFAVSVAPRPVVTAPAAQAALVNQSATLSVGSFAEAGASGPWSVAVDWGDGSPVATFAATAQGSLGTLTHAYTTTGTKSVTVTVTNASLVAGSAAFQVNVTYALSPDTLPDGTVLVSYDQTIAAGGQAPHTFAVLGSPPAGLTLDVSGRLSGAPTQLGLSPSFTVRATDANGVQVTRAYTVFAASPPLGQVDGRAWAWGANGGRLGDGTTDIRRTPSLVSNLTGVSALAGGNTHTLALGSDGSVWAWGAGNVGQLGDGANVTRLSPVPVGGLVGVTAIAAGGNHSLALRSDGTAWAGGLGTAGQLGDGVTANSNAPVQVIGLAGVTAIAAGNTHSLAVKSDGTVWAWGAGSLGQLGNGATANSSTPVQVTGLTGATTVASRGGFSLALTADGTVWSWGSGLGGQLGDGNNLSRSTPVQVSGLAGVTAVAAGSNHSLARRADGTVWAWGGGLVGQLGNGGTANRNTPVQVAGLAGATAVAAGSNHSLALGSDGSISLWGQGNNGQLGNGGTANSTTPIQVPGLTGVAVVAAGNTHSMAITRQTAPPTLAALSPSSATANGTADLSLTVTGSDFPSGATVRWNGSPLATTSVSNTTLTATIPAAHLATAGDVTVATVTVVGPAPGAPASNALPFTITKAGIEGAETALIPPGGTGTVSGAPTAPGTGGVSATLNNAGGTGSATVTVGSYDTNPHSANTFKIGNSAYVELNVGGAGSGASLIARFYYPSTISGGAENSVKLRYFAGDAWIDVLSSGGAEPLKETTDDLDGTVSGGRYTLTFDATSTPTLAGLSGTAFVLGVENTAPAITGIVGPPTGPVAAPTTVSLTASFFDVDAIDAHTCAVAWDDGSISAGTVAELGGVGTCSASHAYAAAGVYTLAVTVRDDDGGTTTVADQRLVVVYDPDAGFVTGGGWIDAPAGARANFSFVARYKKGAATPEGNAELNVQAGGLRFKATGYDSLVVSGSKVQLQGRGTVDGAAGYGIRITAYDGEPDRVRVKVTDAAGAVVFDNRPGVPDDLDAADPPSIGGGSVVVHRNG